MPRILALYHVIQALHLLAQYLVDGSSGRSDIFARMDSHFNDAMKAIQVKSSEVRSDIFELQLALSGKLLRTAFGVTQSYYRDLLSPI